MRCRSCARCHINYAEHGLTVMLLITRDLYVLLVTTVLCVPARDERKANGDFAMAWRRTPELCARNMQIPTQSTPACAAPGNAVEIFIVCSQQLLPGRGAVAMLLSAPSPLLFTSSSGTVTISVVPTACCCCRSCQERTHTSGRLSGSNGAANLCMVR